MAVVFIPPLLQPLTEGTTQVDLEARSVRAVIDELDARFPGVRERLCEDGGLRSGIAVSINGRISSRGLLEKLAAADEVHFLPAIGGG